MDTMIVPPILTTTKEVKMKKCWLAIVIVLSLVMMSSGTTYASEQANREECLAKVEEAARLIKEIGLQPALEKFMDKKGPYIWKDSYIFCMDDEAGKILAHPVPRIIGFPMKNWKDADGKQPFEQPIAEISTKKSGWIKYYYRAPGAETPRLKVAYFLKVPGEKAIVSAGYYE